MAETINLKKRLIGKEDVNFDVFGEGETENFVTDKGEVKQLSKINASHLPLTAATRNEVNEINVDSAIRLVNKKIDGFASVDVLTEDVTVVFTVNDTLENIQSKINQQKKNLNGHILTFLFPSSFSQNFYSSLLWQDFSNGTVVIAGGRSESKIPLYDQLDIGQIFHIYRCQCEVKIKYFYFVHQHSRYAIFAESSTSVVAEDCLFNGMPDADSYAIGAAASNAVFIDSQFNNDKTFYDMFLYNLSTDIEQLNEELKDDIQELDLNKANLSLDNLSEEATEVILTRSGNRIWESELFDLPTTLVQISHGLGDLPENARAELLAKCTAEYYGWEVGEIATPYAYRGSVTLRPEVLLRDGVAKVYFFGSERYIADVSDNTSIEVFKALTAENFKLFIRIQY